MTTARDIMHAGPQCVAEHETLTAAAQHMRNLGVGALPICGGDDRLHGMLTTMEEHQVRRLPVVEADRLVGIVSEADIARDLPEHAVAHFIKAVCTPQAIASS